LTFRHLTAFPKAGKKKSQEQPALKAALAQNPFPDEKDVLNYTFPPHANERWRSLGPVEVAVLRLLFDPVQALL
jgi:hypothetical protein